MTQSKETTQPAQSKSLEEETEENVRGRDIPWKYILLGVVGVLVLFFASLIFAFGSFAWNFRVNFEQTADTSVKKIIKQVQSGWEDTAVTSTTNGRYKHILILGTDTTPARTDRPALTDTIMLMAVDLETGHINTLSLPRDLYNQAYQTRINALYSYGEERNPNDPTDFPEQVLEDMTGVEIHHTIVISLRTLATMVDQVDGVTIDVEKGFIDPNFPNFGPESETDPYRTVQFEAGTQRMDGPRVLDYIRSRKAEGDQGTDEARSERQRVVIEQLVARFMEPTLWLDPFIVGNLYQLYNTEFSQYLSLPQIVATGKKLLPVRNSIQFISNGIPIYPDDPDGVIYHPPQSEYDGQWVYVIRDQSAFAEYVENSLHQ